MAAVVVPLHGQAGKRGDRHHKDDCGHVTGQQRRHMPEATAAAASGGHPGGARGQPPVADHSRGPDASQPHRVRSRRPGRHPVRRRQRPSPLGTVRVVGQLTGDGTLSGGDVMTTDQILMGLGLTVVLAVGSQVVANRLRLPAIIVLLVVGFAAGAATPLVNPNNLLGAAFQPLVSLAVAVILYDAGLSLDVRRLVGRPRRVVTRLIAVGIPLTWAVGALVAGPLLKLSWGAAATLGAILVVSGPTVVAPLLEFVRPSERVQRILTWEASLVDPVGATLGALVFAAVASGTRPGVGRDLLEFVVHLGTGALGAALGLVTLWFVLVRLAVGEILGTACQLAVVIGIAAACDAVRDDAGLIAAILLGLLVGNSRRFDVPDRRPFLETLVQLVLGILFISIAATVTPASLRPVALPALGLIAALVLVARPAAAFVSTVGSDLSRGERILLGWMAPRGIVAAATASTFGATLVHDGVGGAAAILPVTFLVITVTVTLYGLTAVPVARRLKLARPPRTRPLIIGGDPWVVDLAQALRRAGLDVLMWAASEQERDRVRQAGLELASGDLFAAAAGGRARLAGVSMILLLTGEDDFNSLAAVLLADCADGPVHRVGQADPGVGVVAPYLEGEALFAVELSRNALTARYAAGDRVTLAPAGTVPPAGDLLFVLRANGELVPVTPSRTPAQRPGDAAVILAQAPVPIPPPRHAGPVTPSPATPRGRTAE